MQNEVSLEMYWRLFDFRQKVSPENRQPGERTRVHDTKLVQPRSDRIRATQASKRARSLVTQNYL